MNKILWVDLEATGLDPDEDVILEIGLRITNIEGDNLAEYTRLVWTPRWRAHLVRNELVFEMHQKSGLVDALEDLERGTPTRKFGSEIAHVERDMVNWIQNNLGDDSKKMPMSGNSIHYDRTFLAHHARTLHDQWHYRNNDVSSTREQMRMRNWALFQKLPVPPKAHRPQGDIDNSVALWQWLGDNFLFIA